MIIEYDDFDDLKQKLREMGYYITKKPSPVGKLLKCKNCGRKLSSYNIRIRPWESYFQDETYYIADIKCKCGNRVGVTGDTYETKHDIECRVVRAWNKYNSKEKE